MFTFVLLDGTQLKTDHYDMEFEDKCEWYEFSNAKGEYSIPLHAIAYIYNDKRGD